MPTFRALLGSLLLATAWPALSHTGDDRAVIRVEPEVAAAPAPKSAAGKEKPRASHRTFVELAAASAKERSELEAPRKAGVPMQIGFPRPIAALQDEDGTGRDRKSTRLNSSHLARSRMPSSA